MSFNLGNAVKYLWRYNLKNGLEDLKKARWYLEDLIKQMESKQMKDIDGSEMSEAKILEEACDLMADVCCLLYETTEETSHAAAFMADACLKHLQAIKRGYNVLSAAADYQAFEEEVYQAKMNAQEKREGFN